MGLCGLFSFESAGRSVVTLACLVPDVDGLGLVPASHAVLWVSEYHHSLHSLPFAAIVGSVALALTRRWNVALLVFASFPVHRVEDFIESRGPDGDQWSIPHLKPFSSHLQLIWHAQWALNAWQN